jgi:hypothetical protein
MEPLSRRRWMGLAGLGALGLGGGLGTLARALSQPSTPADHRAVILLWLDGGPSQLETFDPHPGTAIAAGTRAIETAAPGIQLAEGLDRLAEQMRDVSLVRSLVSKEGDHERATYYVKNGYRLDPTMVHPSLGAIVCDQLPAEGMEIPRHVSILPGRWPARGGFLGASLDAFKIGDPQGRLPDVTPHVSPERSAQRFEGLAVVDRTFAAGRELQVEQTRHAQTIAEARTMMGSAQLEAFDVGQEPDAVRERYGDTAFGRGCLAARRLVEVGARCVEVTLEGWDTHVDNHENTRPLVHTLDAAFAALVADLREREMLSQTVVLCGGEFGRTPQIIGSRGAITGRTGSRSRWPAGVCWVDTSWAPPTPRAGAR